jgi:glycosyltransferase involved in cell wall biosynthesis
MARVDSVASDVKRVGPAAPRSGRAAGTRRNRRPRQPAALIIVQNLPVPLDRRVWQEARTLQAAGFAVTVICPKGGKHKKAKERLDGVDIRRFGMPVEGRSTLGILLEYAWSALAIFLAATAEALRRRPDVVQICNPPDFLIFLVLHLKLFFGSKIIFDHHDLNPELYEVKFGKRGLVRNVLFWLERMTFRLADVSIACNASFAKVASERGKRPINRIWTVYGYMRKGAIVGLGAAADGGAAREADRKLRIGYLGVIGSQDGVGAFVEAAAVLLSARDAERLDFVVIGDGPDLARVRQLAQSLGVDKTVRFTGFLSGAALQEELRGFDIGVAPDPPNALNTRLSMNKVFEYLAVGAPVVHLGLEQAGADAGPCGVKAPTPDAGGLAAAIRQLIDDPALRAEMRKAALLRAQAFTWESQEPAYLGAYAQALGARSPAHIAARAAQAAPAQLVKPVRLEAGDAP